MEWFRAKITRLNGLSNVEEKKDILTEIKIKLGSLSRQELTEVASNLNLSQFFSELTSNDREIIEHVCNILNSLTNALEAGEIHERYSNEMCMFISHREAIVKTLVLQELLRTATKLNKLPQLLRDTELLTEVVERVADDDLMVAKSAMAILKKVGDNSDGLKILYTGSLLRTFARLLAKSDVISLRIYEIVVDVSKSSKEGLQASVQSGFLNSLIMILENEDVLLQLNALEAITSLALTQEGLDFLEQQEVLKKLSERIAHATESPLSVLLIPGLMKFFGSVAQCRPNEIFSKYPVVISALFEVLESTDPTILSAALDTLGHISTSIEGKYALQDLGNSMPCALKKIAEVIQNMPSELRIRGLNNLALILDVKESEQDNRILSLTKCWFDSLGEDPLGMIVTLCKQPFADIRQASLEVLAVVASQVWGQEYIASCPGLTEFLLDRQVEAFKECKEAKYNVIRNLSQAVSNIFDASTIQRFKQFVNEGPVYTDTNVDVAIEGAS